MIAVFGYFFIRVVLQCYNVTLLHFCKNISISTSLRLFGKALHVSKRCLRLLSGGIVGIASVCKENSCNIATL